MDIQSHLLHILLAACDVVIIIITYLRLVWFAVVKNITIIIIIIINHLVWEWLSIYSLLILFQ